MTPFRHFISQVGELKSAQFKKTAFYGVHLGHGTGPLKAATLSQLVFAAH